LAVSQSERRKEEIKYILVIKPGQAGQKQITVLKCTLENRFKEVKWTEQESQNVGFT
jgi:hypothetical protein